MRVEEKRLSDLSTIDYRIFVHQDEGPPHFGALVVSFQGTFRVGCRGDPDSDYMCAMLRAALTVWRFEALVIDLRELSYRWGDMMSAVMTIGRRECPSFPLPVVVVLSDRCRPAILTLIEPVGVEAPPDALADGVEEAIAKARVLAKARRDAMGPLSILF